ncbi:winged helix-turn-helix domain-containing protein [Hymenobacter mucosus]|nr:winged helix-turn-helix domain-containing protein [Hymenobacter mucosus]
MLEFTSIRAFYEFLQAPPPPDDDFAVRRLEDAQRLVNKVSAPAFRHCFYVIALHLTGNVAYHAGSAQRYLDGPFVFFSRPYQLTSWELPTDAVLHGFHLMFAESFLRRYPALAGLVGKLPYLQVGKAVPFAIEPADVILLTSIYQQIIEECYGGKPDRFDLIATYLQTLLFQVRRLYDKATAGTEPAHTAAGSADEALVGRCRSLDVYITRLRRYLTADEQVQIVNIRGVGYKLMLESNGC